ncbi:DUF6270 domain-containing protein [Isoptericola sp. AK164]|uniref:DUF6270 domain-containing protein n=1 Tax=Isoptericola sp. AK164 TaxID=3024246 RepID=UPI0024181FC2|nr:DUF6270 domain-containing protein [Isoptericola sp. AK164]
MRKTRVFIYGSCVARDTFEFLNPDEFELVQYVARHSAISAYTKPVDLIEPPTLESSFKQRAISGDFASTLRTTIPTLDDIDLVLMDLTDERLGVYILPDGSVVTRSIELIESGAEEELPEGSHHIAFGSDLHLQYWSTGIMEMSKLFQEHMPRSAIALLGIPWASRSEDGSQTPSSFGISAQQINPLLRAYVDFAARTLGARIIDVDTSIVRSNPRHPWGEAPFHFSKNVYLDAVRSLTGQHGRDPWPQQDELARDFTDDAPQGDTAVAARTADPPPPQPTLSSTNTLYEAHVATAGEPTLVYLENSRQLNRGWPLRRAINTVVANHVRIADPTLTDHDDLSFGWGVGGYRGAGVQRIVDTVREVVGNTPLIFAGTGPMGYAAIRCGLETGSPILVHNPDLLWNTRNGSEPVNVLLALAEKHGLADEHPSLDQLPVPSNPVRLLASANASGSTAGTRVIPGLLTLLNDQRRIASKDSAARIFSDPDKPYAPWEADFLAEQIRAVMMD